MSYNSIENLITILKFYLKIDISLHVFLSYNIQIKKNSQSILDYLFSLL